MENRPLISVIVPVYGTEKYLRKCLDSILNQTYKEIELIIVNDASRDNSEEIIKEYMNMDERIKYVRHAKNRGLFQARISGAEEATGEYIAFVDSDDMIAVDYYRQAINRIVEAAADVVISNTVNVDENSQYNVNSIYCALPYTAKDIYGEEIFKIFMEQEGSCFLWHTIWNKIYKKSLWDKCMPHYSCIKKHVIMTEDMAFSTILFYYAQHVTFAKCDGVFYYRHSEASTSAKKTKSQILKYIGDLDCVFSFLENFINKTVCTEKYSKLFEKLKARYFRIWCGNVTVSGFSEDMEVREALFEAFGFDEFETPYSDEFYFYSAQTTWDSRLENLKVRILDPRIEIVSFDIFDTLIYRPLWNPEDIFDMLNRYFHQIYPESKYKFSDIRKNADIYERKKISIELPMLEDISLKEIYAAMKNLYNIPDHIIELMMEKEIETEMMLVYPRQTAVELLNMAVHIGKKVILVSDMYLAKDTIEALLEKCGVKKYSKLYVSSECKVLKRTGSLFRYVISDLNIKGKEESVIHIGDNWESDVIIPQKLGFRSAFFPKAREVFANGISDINAGESFNALKMVTKNGINYQNMFNDFAIKSLLAIIANKLYDNPFKSMDKQTHYHCDPYFVGYYALGMHIIGVAKWILDNAIEKGYQTIHFLSRDGFLIKKVFDIMKKKYPNAPKSNYLHATRKSLIPMFINDTSALYALSEFIDIKSHSPKKLLTMLKQISKEVDFLDENYRIRGIGDLDKDFSNIFEFYNFIDAYIEINYDADKAHHLQEEFRNWLNNVIGSKDATFDIGYSGRLQEIICNILQKPIDSFYIYKSGSEADERAEKNGFRLHTFYNFCPALTGSLREYFISDPGPSCIGYTFSKGLMEPEFEEDKYKYEQRFAINQMFLGVEDFANDVIELWGEKIVEMHFNPLMVSLPFETFLARATSFDRIMFSNVKLEDDVYGGYSAKKLVDIWNWNTDFYGFESFREADKNCGFQTYNYITSAENSKKKLYEKVAIFYDSITDEKISLEEKISKCADNTNNLVVWNALQAIIDPKIISSWYMKNPGGFSKSSFDTFLTTSLMSVQENQDLTWLEDVLERIGEKILLPVGIGFSTETEKKGFSLKKESIRTLAKIAERCKSIGVCGEYSAEILSSFGIKNSVIIGSPVMYNQLPKLKGFHNEVNNIRKVSASFKPFYGVLSREEKSLLNYFAVNNFDMTESTMLELTKFNIEDDSFYLYLKEYERKKNIYFSITEWEKSFKETDFAIGMNFYNNVMALQSKIPALFINYETVGKELCKHYKLPSIDINNFDAKKEIAEYYRMADYSEFFSCIEKRFIEFCNFIKENKVSLSNICNRFVEK